MSAGGDTEVFIPQQARVITLPVRSLPSSITKKMSACSVHSDRPATFISPVELRDKGTPQKAPHLTPGQFLLPVATSNRKAFRMLRKFLHSGGTSLQFSDESSRAGSDFSKRKNSIILFDAQIFLVLRKAKAPDWPPEQRSSTHSECQAPPLNSPVKMGGGSDITEGRSEEGTGGAEDHGKSAEKRRDDCGVMEFETQVDDITDRNRSKDGTGAAEDHGKCTEVFREREADVLKGGEVNKLETLMKDASTNTPDEKSRYIKTEEEEESGDSAPAHEAQGEERRSLPSLTQNPELTGEQGRANETRSSAENHTGNEKRSSDNLKHGDGKTGMSDGESSSAKAKCCKRLIFSGEPSPSLTDVTEPQDKGHIKGQISDLEKASDKTEATISAAEIDGVTCNTERVCQEAAEGAGEDVTNSAAYISIEMREGPSSCCESPVQIIELNDEDCVSGVSSDDESISKIESLLEKCEGLKWKINACITARGSQVKLKKCKSEDVVVEMDTDCDDLIIIESCAEVESESAGSDAEVTEVDGSRTDKPSGRLNGDEPRVNQADIKPERDGAVRKAASSSAEANGGESAEEIVDLVRDDDPVLSGSDGHRDAAPRSKGRADVKSWVSPSPPLRRPSPVEMVDLNHNDNVILSHGEMVSEHGRQTGDVAKGYKRRTFDGISDVAAEVSDVNGLAKRSKRGDGADFSSGCEGLERAINPKSQVNNYNRDVEIIEVDDDDDDEDEIHRSANDTKESVEILDLPGPGGDGAESQSPSEKIQSVSTDQAQIIELEDLPSSVTHPGGTSETPDEGQDDQTDLIHSGVEIMVAHEKDQGQDEANCKPDVNETLVQTSAAEAVISDVPSSSSKNKSCKTAAEVTDVRGDTQANDSNLIITSDVQNNSVAETMGVIDERENVTNVTDDVVRADPCVPSAAEDRAVAGKIPEPDRDGTTSGASEGGSDPDHNGEQSETANQSACAEEAPPTPPPANQDIDFMVLKREENIKRMKARRRMLDEKLSTMINSDR